MARGRDSGDVVGAARREKSDGGRPVLPPSPKTPSRKARPPKVAQPRTEGMGATTRRAAKAPKGAPKGTRETAGGQVVVPRTKGVKRAGKIVQVPKGGPKKRVFKDRDAFEAYQQRLKASRRAVQRDSDRRAETRDRSAELSDPKKQTLADELGDRRRSQDAAERKRRNQARHMEDREQLAAGELVKGTPGERIERKGLQREAAESRARQERKEIEALEAERHDDRKAFAKKKSAGNLLRMLGEVADNGRREIKDAITGLPTAAAMAVKAGTEIPDEALERVGLRKDQKNDNKTLHAVVKGLEESAPGKAIASARHAQGAIRKLATGDTEGAAKEIRQHNRDAQDAGRELYENPASTAAMAVPGVNAAAKATSATVRAARKARPERRRPTAEEVVEEYKTRRARTRARAQRIVRQPGEEGPPMNRKARRARHREATRQAQARAEDRARGKAIPEPPRDEKAGELRDVAPRQYSRSTGVRVVQKLADRARGSESVAGGARLSRGQREHARVARQWRRNLHLGGLGAEERALAAIDAKMPREGVGAKGRLLGAGAKRTRRREQELDNVAVLAIHTGLVDGENPVARLRAFADTVAERERKLNLPGDHENAPLLRELADDLERNGDDARLKQARVRAAGEAIRAEAAKQEEGMIRAGVGGDRDEATVRRQFEFTRRLQALAYLGLVTENPVGRHGLDGGTTVDGDGPVDPQGPVSHGPPGAGEGGGSPSRPTPPAPRPPSPVRTPGDLRRDEEVVLGEDPATGLPIHGRDREAEGAAARRAERALPDPDSTHWLRESLLHPDRGYWSLVDDVATIRLRREGDDGPHADHAAAVDVEDSDTPATVDDAWLPVQQRIEDLLSKVDGWEADVQARIDAMRGPRIQKWSDAERQLRNADARGGGHEDVLERIGRRPERSEGDVDELAPYLRMNEEQLEQLVDDLHELWQSGDRRREVRLGLRHAGQALAERAHMQLPEDGVDVGALLAHVRERRLADYDTGAPEHGDASVRDLVTRLRDADGDERDAIARELRFRARDDEGVDEAVRMGTPEAAAERVRSAVTAYEDLLADVATAVREGRQLRPEIRDAAKTAARDLERALAGARHLVDGFPRVDTLKGQRILDASVPEDEFLEDLAAVAERYQHLDFGDMVREGADTFEEMVEQEFGRGALSAEEVEWLRGMRADLWMRDQLEDLPGGDPDVDARAEVQGRLDDVLDELATEQVRRRMVFGDSFDYFDEPEDWLRYQALLQQRDVLRDRLGQQQERHGQVAEDPRRAAERPLRARVTVLVENAERARALRSERLADRERAEMVARGYEVEAQMIQRELAQAQMEQRPPRYEPSKATIDRVAFAAASERVLRLSEAIEDPELADMDVLALLERKAVAEAEAAEIGQELRPDVRGEIPDAFRLPELTSDRRYLLTARIRRLRDELTVTQRELQALEAVDGPTHTQMVRRDYLRAVAADQLAEGQAVRRELDDLGGEAPLPKEGPGGPLPRRDPVQRRAQLRDARRRLGARIAELVAAAKAAPEGARELRVEATRLQRHLDGVDAELEELARERVGEPAQAMPPWFRDDLPSRSGVTDPTLHAADRDGGKNYVPPNTMMTLGVQAIEQRMDPGWGSSGPGPVRIVPPTPPQPPSGGGRGGGGSTPPPGGEGPSAADAGAPFPDPSTFPFVFTGKAGARAGQGVSLEAMREVLGEDFAGQYVRLAVDETDAWNFLAGPTAGEGRRSLGEFFNGDMGARRWRDQQREREHATTMRRQQQMVEDLHALRGEDGEVARYGTKREAIEASPAGWVPMPSKMRGQRGDWIVVPKSVGSLLEHWLRGMGHVEAAGAWATRLAIRASLPFSVMWHLGNVVDNYTRLALTLTPAQIASGRALADALEVNLRGLNPRLADELLAPIATGHQSARDMTTQLRLGNVIEGRQPALGVEPTRAERARLQRGERAREATQRFVNEDVLTLPSVLSWTTARLFSGTSRLERDAHRRALGAKALEWANEMGWAMDDWTATMRRAAGEIERRPELMYELQRRVLEVMGDFATRRAGDRLALAGADPFWRWFKAANRFVFHTLPVNHPIQTAIAMQATALTRDERTKMGLNYYLDEDEAHRLAVLLGGSYEQQSGFLAGGLPVGDELVPTAPLSSLGEVAAQFSDPERIPGRIGGFAARPIAAARGSWDPPGEELAKALLGQDRADLPERFDGREVSRARRAASLASEPFVKGAKQGRQVGEQGQFPSPHSTWWDPEPVGEKGSTADGVLEGVMGVGPRERDWPQLSAGELLERGEAMRGRPRRVTFTDPATGRTETWWERG